MANISRILAWWWEVDWRAVAAYAVTGVPAAVLGARTMLVLPPGAVDAAIGSFLLLMIPGRRWLAANLIHLRLPHLAAAGMHRLFDWDRGLVGTCFRTGVHRLWFDQGSLYRHRSCSFARDLHYQSTHLSRIGSTSFCSCTEGSYGGGISDGRFLHSETFSSPPHARGFSPYHGCAAGNFRTQPALGSGSLGKTIRREPQSAS